MATKPSLLATSLSPGDFRLFWLASNIDQIKEKNQPAFASLERLSKSIEVFTDNHAYLDHLMEDQSSEKIILLASGSIGQSAVPIIHDMAQIDSIFIFCLNKSLHERWSKEFSKIKGVFNHIDEMCLAVEKLVQKRQLEKEEKPKAPEAARHRVRSAAHAGAESGAKVAPKPARVSFDVRPPREAFVDTVAAPIPVVREEEHSPVEPFHAETGHSSPLINLRRPAERVTTTAEPDSISDFDRLDHTLVASAEQDVRASLFNDANLYRSTSLAQQTMDRLQTTLVQAIEKHVTKKNDDSDVLSKLFADLKQAVVDTLIQQQQPSQLQDIIKQSVADALALKQSLRIETKSTTTMVPGHKPIVVVRHPEIQISANTELTRVDATFRQQRAAVIANRGLRNAVQQWASMASIAELAAAIKLHGKNDLERAWLLFCWVVQNIRYKPHCNINAAEAVFRTKQGVCRGFVSLYHECCSRMDIQCYEIAGYSKQTLLKPGEDLGDPMHAWNSIVLENRTYLLDATWGVGSGENEETINDFYFLTSPEELIYSHFSVGYQLLKPEISKQDFIRLPLMRATYYRLGLQLQSPKQGFNETSQNIFHIVLRKPEDVDLFLTLQLGDTEYPRSLHTMCQRDETSPDIYNCYAAPPVAGLYDIVIYAKSRKETTYPDAIRMKLRVTNIVDPFCFPMIYSTFTEHKCVLIAPFRRFVQKDELVLIHMIIPNCNVLEVQNGKDSMAPCVTEYKNGVLKKEVRVQGDLKICARWNDNADSISILCIFTMM